MKKQAVLSLSGGMDSSTLLLHLLAHDYEVTALSFDYGQKHNVELERASELMNSESHRNTILDNEFNRVGIGIISGPTGLIIVQIFSR